MDDMATEIFGGIRENYQSQYVSFAYANNGNNVQGSAPAVNMNSANNASQNNITFIQHYEYENLQTMHTCGY